MMQSAIKKSSSSSSSDPFTLLLNCLSGAGAPVIPAEAVLPHSLRPSSARRRARTASPHLSPMTETMLRFAVQTSLSLADVRRNFLFSLQDWRDRLGRLLPYGTDWAQMDSILQRVEANASDHIALLAAAVAIPSVSTSPQVHYEAQLQNADFFRKRLEAVGLLTEKRELPGKQTIADGRQFPLPPLILARKKDEDPKKKTLLVYGHIDVQPAALEDGWSSPPFELSERDGKLYGRGTTDDKGPVLCWTNALEAFQQQGVELPINVRFLLEAMEETGSQGLAEELRRMHRVKDPLLQNVDFVAIADTYWMGDSHPCVTYGIRGNCTFELSVQCANRDLHSGCTGGMLNEAMSDLIYFMDHLVDQNGRILIPGIYDSVKPLTPEEAALYDAIAFTPEEKRQEFGLKHLLDVDDPSKILQRLWREPALSLHGIEGAYSDAGFKTVIPGKVTGKFSIRIVPDMQGDRVNELVRDHIKQLQAARGTKNLVTLHTSEPGPWYMADPYGANFTAARLAVRRVYGVDPYLTREGGSIPISIVLSEVTGKEVCFICVGRASDGAHGPNEKIDKENYIKGAQMMAVYFHELASQS